MPLYNESGEKLPSSFSIRHWSDFNKFVGSELHTIFIKHIKDQIETKEFNSSIIGKKILTNIGKSDPAILKKYAGKNASQLFGMTLWHY